MSTSLPRGVARCQHIKVNGTRCDSPALKGKAHCYFHYRYRLQDSVPKPLAEGRPPAASVPPDLFLLEDANSIQCALQWVLRRILTASIDHRQASLLLYGLQIAAANVKRTRFEPLSATDVIRTLPSDPSTDTPAQAVFEPVPASSDQSRNTGAAGQALSLSKPGLDEPISIPPNEPAPPATASPDSPQLATDRRPLTTPSPDSPKLPNAQPRPQRTSRRPPSKSPATDNWRLTTVKPALSLMFQREVRRHLSRLNFPASPDPDPES